MKLAVATHLGCDASRLHLRHGVTGAPILHSDDGRDVTISVSYSDHWAGVLVSECGDVRLGLDLCSETAFAKWDRVSDLILSPGELRLLERLPPAARQVFVCRAWMRKEAVLKSLGVGLRCDPRQVPAGVALDDGDASFDREGHVDGRRLTFVDGLGPEAIRFTAVISLR